MAPKAPREVAGLGRPETPDEKLARIAQSRAERRSRQTIKNLVWSMLASLGVVVLLVLVVARPDDNLVQPVEWTSVAEKATVDLSASVVQPALPEGWSANRAEVTNEPGTGGVWSLGLITDDRAYVFLDQGFQADASWVAGRTQLSRPTGDVTLTLPGGSAVLLEEYDRQEVDPGGNYAYLLVLTLEDSTIVLGGSDAESVTELARAVVETLPETP